MSAEKPLKTQAIKISPRTMEELASLEIEVAGVELKTYEQKISHLIWFYKHYKNNNGSVVQK